jgi:hypothetical protein
MPPSSLDGIEKYLDSGMVKGIGPHFAKKLTNFSRGVVGDQCSTSLGAPISADG